MQYFDDDDCVGMYRVTGNKFDLSKPIVKNLKYCICSIGRSINSRLVSDTKVDL
jgi:hypothetical protein